MTLPAKSPVLLKSTAPVTLALPPTFKVLDTLATPVTTKPFLSVDNPLAINVLLVARAPVNEAVFEPDIAPVTPN